MPRVLRRLLSVSFMTMLTLSLTISSPPLSRADAIYTAVTLLDLTIIGFSDNAGISGEKPSDLRITGDAFVVDEDTITDGNAVADRFASAMVVGSNPNDIDINEGLSQQAVVSGKATTGTAVSFVITQSLLEINNLSLTESYSVDFIADVTYLVDTSITDPNLEFSTSTSEVFLKSMNRGSLLDQTMNSDSDISGEFLTDRQEFPFSIFVEPQSSDVFTLTANVAGTATATAPVPEPSTFGLLAIGLIGTALFQWRQTYSLTKLANQTIYVKK